MPSINTCLYENNLGGIQYVHYLLAVTYKTKWQNVSVLISICLHLELVEDVMLYTCFVRVT